MSAWVWLALVLTAGADGGVAPDLVDAAASVPGLVVDLRYATADNFLGEAVYPPGARCLLLRPVAARLAAVARALAPAGYRLHVWDCYRPLHVQWAMWQRVPRKGYVADPRTGSHHNRGAAVDLTLDHADGTPVAMPTPFDTFGPDAYQSSDAGTAQARSNRDLLRKAMVDAGFRPNRMEWWHYDAPEARHAPVLDLPVEPTAR
jgi:D-alanyl-D-alanine dipeptidase